MHDKKIKLINWFLLTPDEASFMLGKVDFDFITRNDFISGILSLKFDIKNEENLFLYYITRKIYSTENAYKNLLSFEEENADIISSETSIDDYYEEEEYDSDIYDYKTDRALSKTQKKSIETLIDYVSTRSDEDIMHEIVQFIIKEKPSILMGFDKSLYREGKELYRCQFGEVRPLHLPYETWVKIRDAQNKAESIVKSKILEYQESQYSIWAKEFVEYANKFQLKINKTNVSNYLKNRKIKGDKFMSELLLNLIKK